MEAMIDLMQSQINRAISSAISEIIIPEIQNMVKKICLWVNMALSRVRPQMRKESEAHGRTQIQD